MASTREIRSRIRSVKSTRQITKAMELVSASKMRRASESTLASRPYSRRLQEVVQDILRSEELRAEHPLLAAREVKRVVALVFSSDLGLAGAYDPTVIKNALRFASEQQELGREVSFITWGRRIENALLRAGITIVQSYPHSASAPLPVDIFPVGSFLVEAFREHQFDEVTIIYTDFVSSLTQQIRSQTLLPLRALPHHEKSELAPSVLEFIYEPSASEVLTALLPRLIEVEIYQALLESLASEHAARRLAMKNATDNASDMIDDLTLLFNGMRQSAITQEIAEITSGAAALN